MKHSSVTVLLLLFLVPVAFGQLAQLRVVTVNTWSGLDYQGVLRFGEYQSAEQRRLRFQSLVRQIGALDPDVIFVQEGNPLPEYASRLAEALELEEIHQVSNAGVHMGPVGVPANFREGLVILARPSLMLELVDVWKLSGAFGIYGDLVTVHLDESVFALTGRIMLGDTPVYLVNVHLVASPTQDSAVLEEVEILLERGEIGDDEYRVAVDTWLSRLERRRCEVRRLLRRIEGLSSHSPVIVAGDFNSDRDTPEMQTFTVEGGFFNADIHRSIGDTWDPQGNENIGYSASHTDARNRRRSGYDLLSALANRDGATIDYIFLNTWFDPGDVLDSRRVLDEKVDGIHVSDHYGVLADIAMTRVLQDAAKEVNSIASIEKGSIEPLPILMYDSNIGVGYGVKLFLLNQLHHTESFDLTLFNSTKGEQWYRFVGSWPDFELRQGKVYPIAADLTIEYDKLIKASFFGIGNRSRYEDREYYTKEAVDISLAFSRGLSSRVVVQAGVRFKTIRNYNFEEDSQLRQLPPDLNSERVSYFSSPIVLRYDTRNTVVHPSRGMMLQAEMELAPDISQNDVTFTRASATAQSFSVLFYPKTVLALRAQVQYVSGHNLPVQVLLPLGGGRTMRGLPMDRFFGRTTLVSNAEIRFPIYRRLGGVGGIDVGKVWDRPDAMDLHNWEWNPAAGLYYCLRTFVVRLDVGFGRDEWGVFLNFGHMF